MISKAAQLCLVLTTIIVCATAQATPCELARQLTDNNKDITSQTNFVDIRSTRQENGGLAFVAHTRWPYPPERLFRLVTAYDDFSSYIPRVTISRILQQEEQRMKIYQRLHFPAPMNDRHYVMQSEKQADMLHRHYRVNWSLIDQQIPDDVGPAVIPKQLRGCWDIRGTEAGGTDAVYWITIEPGGLVPIWLAHTGTKHYLSELMQAIGIQLGK